MPNLTVFTPTYNRAHTLSRTYDSLCRQTCRDFCWLIIDDGSEDDTRAMVQSWQAQANFSIEYIYKENGGLHTAYNAAIERMTTELCVCVDSDDWMPDDAVEKILDCWHKNENTYLSGIIGKDYKPDGKPIGNDFPNVKFAHIVELMSKYSSYGDRKIVMRVDLLKKVYPQPTLDGERNFNPIYLMLKVDQFYPFVLLNENLCFVEYQENGMAANIVNQYFNSPNSFIELRKLYLSLKYTTWKWRTRQYVHLIANCKMAKRNPFAEGLNNVVIAFLYPVGLALYYYLRQKRKL